MSSKLPLAINDIEVIQVDDQRSKRKKLSNKMLEFGKYMIAVLIIHLIVLELLFYFTYNEDSKYLLISILIFSIGFFVFNFSDNPDPKYDHEMYKAKYI